MTRLTIAGRLTAAADRRLRGRLLPYGAPGHTNLGRVVCLPGNVPVPGDVSTLFAHLDHMDERDDVAAFVSIVEQPDGMWAEWDVPTTHGGDRLLAEFRSGRRTGVSVELEPVAVRDGVVYGTLIGCAFPVEPAFADARLVAELAPDTAEQPTDPAWLDSLPAWIDRAAFRRDVLGVPDPAPAADPQTPPAPAEGTPAVNPDDDNTGGTMTAAAPAATAPAALLAGAATSSTPPSAPSAPTPSTVTTPLQFFRLLAEAHSAVGSQRTRLLAALSDIVPADTVNMEQPQWVGELWSGVGYQRRFVPLINRAQLTSLNMEGWRWVTKPEVAPYSGNKTAVPSNAVDTEPVTKAATRWAGAHDIDRAHRDFSNSAFFAAYYAAMTESYAIQSDAHIPAQLKAGATIVAPGTVPTDVSVAMAAIVDGALAVLDKGVPSFAIVEKSLYRSLLLTPRDQVLEFLSASLGLEDGTFAGFRIVPQASTAVGDASSSTGLDRGEVLVGTRNAATFYELGDGVPIRAEAVDLVNGGIDAGVFGYGGVIVHDSEALALVETDPDT